MPALRFNHMELTFPPGALERDRDAIVAFYSEVFGFNAIDVPLFDAAGLLLATDDDGAGKISSVAGLRSSRLLV